MHEHHGANRSVVIMYIQVNNWIGNRRWKDVTELTQIQSIKLTKIKSDFMPYFQLKKMLHVHLAFPSPHHIHFPLCLHKKFCQAIKSLSFLGSHENIKRSPINNGPLMSNYKNQHERLKYKIFCCEIRIFVFEFITK